MEKPVLHNFNHKNILTIIGQKKGAGSKEGNQIHLWKKENKKEQAKNLRGNRAAGMQKSQNSKGYDSGVSE